MTLKKLEQQLARMRENGATDKTPVKLYVHAYRRTSSRRRSRAFGSVTGARVVSFLKESGGLDSRIVWIESCDEVRSHD